MNDEDSPPVLTEITGNTAIIRLNRPRQRNPLSLATLQALQLATRESVSRTDINALIFIGTANAFASGANINELARLDSKSALQFSKFGQQLFQMIADCNKLTIAAINGYCMGGGLDFALACDIRVASTTATFSHPGARLGIITGWGGTQRLPRVVGRTRALNLLTTGHRISSESALSMGLITTVKDPVLACALELAQTSQGSDKSPR